MHARDDLTPGQAADIAGCPSGGILRACRLGKLRHERWADGSTHIRRDDLAAFLQRQAEDAVTVWDYGSAVQGNFADPGTNPIRRERA